MKSITAVVEKAITQKSIDSCNRRSQKPQDEKVIVRLFASMALKYAQRWTSQFPSQEIITAAQMEWATQLAGYSLDQIRRGLNRSVDKYPSWPPTIGEFIALCRSDPESLGLPLAHEAWIEICTGASYSHGIVFAVRRDWRCDYFNWRLLPTDKAIKKFTPIYQEYINRAIGGEVFDLPVMLDKKPPKTLTQEQRTALADRYLGDLKEALRC